MKQVQINSVFAQRCGEALVAEHNSKPGGSVRLMSFRQLYLDLKELGCSFLIASAIKPEEYPNNMWWPNEN